MVNQPNILDQDVNSLVDTKVVSDAASTLTGMDVQPENIEQVAQLTSQTIKSQAPPVKEEDIVKPETDVVPEETAPAPEETAPAPEETVAEVSIQDRMLQLRLSLARGEDPNVPKKFKFKLGDTEIIVNHVGPGQPSTEEVQSAVVQFRSTPEFENLVDKETGAPIKTRLQVGSAITMEDKLATARRTFPDAVIWKGDNILYTDPHSGRPTLINPPGLDVGDVAGSAREITQTVFSAGGAAFGGAGGFVLGAPTGPGAILTTAEGAILGAGIGNAVGGSTFDAMANFFGLTVDSRDIIDKSINTGVDFVSGAGGQKVGDLIAPVAQKVLGGGKSAAQSMYNKFKSLGIEPPAGATTGSTTIGSLEKGLEVTPGSASIMQDKATQTINQVKSAADKIVAKFGQAKSTQGAGQTIKQAAIGAAERFGFKQEALYTKAFDKVGADTPVAVDGVRELLATLKVELAGAPNSLSRALKPAIQKLNGIVKDIEENGAISFQSIRDIRSALGKELDAPVLTGTQSTGNAAKKRVYGALTQDMSDAAQAAGSDAAANLKHADRFTRIWMTGTAKLMQKIDKFDADEKAFSFLMTASKDGGSALSKLRGHFEPDEWDVVAATVLNKMGKATNSSQNQAGDAFSVSTFLTNYSKMAKDAPEAMKALFSGPRYKEARESLSILVDATESIKGMEKLTNTSNTARNMIAFTTIQTLGGALGGLATGDFSGSAGGVATSILGSVVAPRYAAKLITNPSFVKWLVTPITNPSKIGAHIGRLIAIAKAEPDIREEIEQYSAALRSVPKGKAK